MRVKFHTSVADTLWSVREGQELDTKDLPIDDKTLTNYLASGYCEEVKGKKPRKAVQKPAQRKAVERY